MRLHHLKCFPFVSDVSALTGFPLASDSLLGALLLLSAATLLVRSLNQTLGPDMLLLVRLASVIS